MTVHGGTDMYMSGSGMKAEGLQITSPNYRNFLAIKALVGNKLSIFDRISRQEFQELTSPILLYINLILGFVQCTHFNRDVFIVDSQLNEREASSHGKVLLHVFILGVSTHRTQNPTSLVDEISNGVTSGIATLTYIQLDA